MKTTARSLQYLRNQGVTVEKTETWNPHSFTRHDLFGLFDLVYLLPGKPGITGVQCVSGKGDVARHLKKMRENPVLNLWFACSNRAALHSWARRGARGKRKLWNLKVIEVI